MGKARVRRLLWVFFLFISGLQVAASSEVTFIRAEGESLEVICPTNIWKHANSMKAWVRLDGAEARPLVFTEKPTGKPTQVQVERYFLEDVPTESILRVRMISLQQADSGLYQCVIYHPPKVSEVLFHPVRLVVTSSTSDEYAFSTLPPTTIKTQRKPQTTSSTTNQISLMPIVMANLTNVTDVSRISVISIIILVACGFLSKSLVFTVLLVVTQRSFGH